MVKEKIICIGCSFGCRTTSKIDDRGEAVAGRQDRQASTGKSKSGGKELAT